jgi:glutathione S-transferase
LVIVVRSMTARLGCGSSRARRGSRPFFGGGALGFVDVALVPFTSWFLAYEKLGGFSVQEHCPRIVAWAARCRERESVAKAMSDPAKVLEFVQFLQSKFGAK